MKRELNMIGVILAAGKGARMYPFSERMPKSILPILGRPILAYQLDAMKQAGIRKVIIVIGYYGFEIVRRIGDGQEWGLEIEYVDQKQTLGIAHAVGALEDRINQPFLLFLGDIFFSVPDLGPLIEPILSGQASGVLAARREPDPETVKRNFAVFLRPDGSVVRVMEKPSYVGTDLKGCGLYAFDLHIFDAVRRTPRTAARDEYEITDSIQLLINDGFRVQVMEDIQHDLNLTSPADLLAANQLELANRGWEHYIGRDFQGPPPERIIRSVIGDRVTLPPGIQVRDAVIFDDVNLKESGDLDHLIITPDKKVHIEAETTAGPLP